MILEMERKEKTIGCFSISLIKHHDHENLLKESLFGVHSFGGLEPITVKER